MSETRPAADPLLAACRLIGAALDLPIYPAPHLDGAHVQRDALDAIAAASHVRTRHVVLRGNWWRRDHGPLLAFRAGNKQPVALLPASPRRYVLVDPSTATRVPVTRDVAASLAAFGVTFYRPLPRRQIGGRELLRLGLWNSRRDLLVVVAMGVATGLLALAAPLATGVIFGTTIPAGQFDQLVLMALALAATAVAGAAFSITRNVALLRLEGRIDATLQAAIVDRLIDLPAAFFRDYTAGDLGDRAMSISAIRQALSETAVTSTFAAIVAAFSLALLVYYDAPLALLVLGLVALLTVVTCAVDVVEVRRRRALMAWQRQTSSQVLQFIAAISRFRVAGAEGRAFARWADQFGRQKQLAYQAEMAHNALAVWNAAYPILASMAIIAAIVARGTLSIGIATFLAFSTAATQLLFAALTLSGAMTKVISSLPLYEQLRPILDQVPEATSGAVHPGDLTGAIELRHVSFRYTAAGPAILDDVSLQIQPGQFVAVVGPSGSGKSTLLRLLVGFERPGTGAILYDGHDLAALDLRAVRRQMGVVLQNGGLMVGDIFHNIIGSSAALVEDAWEAARMAGIDEEIRQLPMGMHTMVSEGGSTLSGGQRQRLLIARAVVHKPRMLFLDEATSALDNRTQALVGASIDQIQVTRVVIAHRLSTIMHADRIFVLDQGKIVQSGSYTELMERDGLFARLAHRQIA